jgi:hypothetical protein
MRPESEATNILFPVEPVHFEVKYNHRNPQQGRGQGPGGVGDERLIKTYLYGLEMLYRALTSPPWSRSELDRMTEVYILDVATIFPTMSGPFTTENLEGAPYIVLPCRTSDPTCEVEQQWALATAVHEATHVFNYRKRPLSSPYSAKWAWFDEALAVFMEMQLITDYRDHFRFLGNWIERPELSLDTPIASYQAGQFVAYLAKRLGIEFVNRVWMDSTEGETPFEAIKRLLPEGQKLVSADPDERDLFASGYCLDSWFLNDPTSLAYAPDLYMRYGERAITESFVLRPGEKVGTTDKPGGQDVLSHLACRYYRFYLEDEVKQLSVELHSSDEPGKSPLKVELAIVTKGNRRGQVIPLRLVSDKSNRKTLLTAQVKQIDSNELDHFILVVTNCGTRSAIPPHDDGKQFTIRARAM